MATSLSDLPDDCLAEALLRLSPEDPACLLLASRTDRTCHRILSSPEFNRCYQQRHPTPSVLGLLHNAQGDATYASRFVPTNPAYGRPAARDLKRLRVLDSRHSRVLFLEPSRSPGAELRYDLVVWNPLTNEYRCLSPPAPPLTAVSTTYFNATVLCSAAVGGCDHRNCHGGTFRVVLVCLLPGVMSARVYDSGTGSWSEQVTVEPPVSFMYMTPQPSTLVGGTLYFRCGFGYCLEYQLGVHNLSFIQGPPGSVSQIWAISLMPMPMENGGGLGCLYVKDDESGLRLEQWSRETADGIAGWAKVRAIELENLLPDAALHSLQFAYASSSRSTKLQLLGSAEAANVIFVGTWSHNGPDAVYMVELNSATRARSRKVFDESTVVVPYTSFCIPVPAPV